MEFISWRTGLPICLNFLKFIHVFTWIKTLFKYCPKMEILRFFWIRKTLEKLGCFYSFPFFIFISTLFLFPVVFMALILEVGQGGKKENHIFSLASMWPFLCFLYSSSHSSLLGSQETIQLQPTWRLLYWFSFPKTILFIFMLKDNILRELITIYLLLFTSVKNCRAPIIFVWSFLFYVYRIYLP